MSWAWMFFCIVCAIFFGVVAYFERKRKSALFGVYLFSSIFQIVLAILHAIKIILKN